MATLPARPDLDHLRRQARDLLRAARAGDTAAANRIGAASGTLNLAAAQLAVAREYGFASWTRLKAAVRERDRDLARLAEQFCQASVRDWSGQVRRMLAETPELATYSFATAVLLGDDGRVRRDLARDPGLAVRRDERWGWTALHAVCASRWYRLDPGRDAGLEKVARLLLDAGADARGRAPDGEPGAWTPLGCVIAADANPAAGSPVPAPSAIARLLLKRGAKPDDRDLYHAGFVGDEHATLRLLLAHTDDVAGTARSALAAPLSKGDIEAVRLLMEAGADPQSYADDHEPPAPIVYAAVRTGAPAALVDLLLARGAAAAAPGPDGRSPYAFAVSRGRTDIAGLLRSYGADRDSSPADEFLAACLGGDLEAARGGLRRDPGLPGTLTDAQHGAALAQAAETGNTAGLAVMLDLGLPIGARGEFGGTPLHAAAYAGSADAVALLLSRGASLEAQDATWNDTPLSWALVGSGQEPDSNPAADWVRTVDVLILAGASTGGITLAPFDPKPPSAAVAEYLRSHGIGVAE